MLMFIHCNLCSVVPVLTVLTGAYYKEKTVMPS